MSDYNNDRPLQIPGFINKLTNLSATKRYHLAYLYALTRKGHENIDYLSGEQSRMLGPGTYKKDVQANIKQFVKMGYIETEYFPGSKNKEDQKMIKWIYNTGDDNNTAQVNKLFDI